MLSRRAVGYRGIRRDDRRDLYRGISHPEMLYPVVFQTWRERAKQFVARPLAAPGLY